jgi:flagellar basal body-associated protein FliL
MKKVLKAFLFLLLLGGGAGGYFYWQQHKEPEPEPPPPLPDFLRLERFVVPIVRQGFIDGLSRIELTLEVVDENARIDLQRNMPKIRDAIQSDLHAYLPLRRQGSAADVTALKKRLMMVVVAVTGEGKVKDLLVEEFMDIPPKKPEGG